MITVSEALDLLFALVDPLAAEDVPLASAAGRVLAHDAVATRDQPPFSAASMDGYAVRDDEARPGARFDVIGEAAAGHGFAGRVASGQALRIFTGAPIPAGADRVVMQEDVTRMGDIITLCDALDPAAFIRPKAADFAIGDRLRAPKRLTPADIALLAAMNVPQVRCTRRPLVALISTGDELVMPGEVPGPDQIIASNTFGLKAILDTLGARTRILPIARDTKSSLHAVFDLAQGADLVVTIGGASVGDHDLVGEVVEELGMARAFYKVRMRPGKPLMAGRMGDAAMVGVPGNPVSALVCGHVFLAPMIHKMLGLGAAPSPRLTARLAHSMEKGGPREHYMRAEVCDGHITPEPRQDSALLSVLANANALMIRPADDRPREAGEEMPFIPL